MSFVSLSPVFVARLRAWARPASRIVLGLTATAVSIVAAAWLTLQWGILPRIDHWRPEVQAWASRALGLPVQVDSLAVRGDLWAPTVQLRGLRLLGADGQPALNLSDAEAVLTPGSLLPASLSDWRPQLRRLTLRGATLDVQRDASGAWRVAGLPLPAAGSDTRSSPWIDWLLRQGDVRLEQSVLRLHDTRLADGAPLVFGDIVLSLQNRLGRHRLTLAADPPPGWGERIDSGIDLHEPLLSAAGLWRQGDWTGWATQLRLDLRQLDLSRAAVLATLLPDAPGRQPSDMPAGQVRLALRAERDRGAWLRLEADIGLSDLVMSAPRARLANPGPAPQLAQIDGRVRAEFGAAATRWTVDRLQLREPARPTPPERPVAQAASAMGTWQLTWTHRSDTDARHTLQLDRAELGALAPLVPVVMPLVAASGQLPAGMRETLQAARPGGVLTDLRLNWPARGATSSIASSGPERSPDAAPGWQVSGHIEGLSLQAAEPTPGAAITAAITAAISAANAAAVAPPATHGKGTPEIAPPPVAWPGLDHARLRFDASAQGGNAELAVRDGALTWPGLFEVPRLPIARLGAELRWQIAAGADGRPASVDLTLRRLEFTQPEFHGSATVHWRSRLPGASAPADAARPARSSAGRPGATPPVWPGRLTLQAQLADIDATGVHRYLPQVLPASVRHYVRDAVRGGRIETLRAEVDGALIDFPFADPATGRFEIGGQLRGVTLDYVPASLGLAGPAWPPFDRIDGELRFERQAMLIRNASARLPANGQGLATLAQVNGGIANLAHTPQLRLAGRVQGPLEDLLDYVNDAPIGGWLGQVLAHASGSGNAAVDLELVIPLLEAARTTVTGRLELRGNAVQLDPRLPRLADVRGDLGFHERGFTLKPTTARALGGALRLSGGMDASTPLQLLVEGQASADGLRAAAPAGPLHALSQRLSGQAAYRLQLSGQDAASLRVDLSSPLVGLALQAPEPLGKPADVARPLRLSLRTAGLAGLTGASGPSATPAQALWDLRLGNRLAARWQADGRSGTPLGGTVQVGDATRDGSTARTGPGWAITAAGTTLSLDAWTDWWADTLAADSAASAAFTSATSTPPPPDLGLSALREIQLRADTLRWQGRSWHRLDLKAQQQAGEDGPRWQAQVDAREIAGRLTLRPGSGRTPAQLNARLTRLELRRDGLPDGTQAVEPSAVANSAPVTASPDDARPPGTAQVLPTLDIEVERFVLGQRPMGQLTLRAGHRPGLVGPSPAWTIDTLRLRTPDATAQASGRWQPVTTAALGGLPGLPGLQGATAGTELAIQLEVSDGGALFQQLGWPGTLSGGRGTLQGRLHWPGLPFDPSPATLGGELKLALAGGRFLQAEPGAARLLGILSLQALPRRFLLDFRDLFQQGFAFDQVDGDVRLQRGQASTRNLRIRGPQALVLTEGSTDLGAETQDLHVWIVPEFDAGAASLAYAAINPVIGLGTLIGQYLLRKPLTAAATREWRITGNWDQPTVTPLTGADATPAPTGHGGAEAPASGTAPDATPASAAAP